jgi:hypothetical protein
MSNVARIEKEPDLRIVVAELQNTVTWQGMLIDALLMNVTEIAGRVDESLPIPIPNNMITIKEAARAAHYSVPRMYRLHQLGLINSSKPTTKGQRILVDRDTLGACIAAHLAKRKKIK